MADPKKANMRASQMGNGYLYIAMGVVFLVVAMLVHDGVALFYFLPFAIIFLIYGSLQVWRMRRLPK